MIASIQRLVHVNSISDNHIMWKCNTMSKRHIMSWNAIFMSWKNSSSEIHGELAHEISLCTTVVGFDMDSRRLARLRSAKRRLWALLGIAGGRGVQGSYRGVFWGHWIDGECIWGRVIPMIVNLESNIIICIHMWIIIWLVVTGTWFLYFPIYWEFHHPNWRTPSFFRGVGRPPTSELSWIIPL